MMKLLIGFAVLAAVIALVLLVVGQRSFVRVDDPAGASSPAAALSIPAPPVADDGRGFLYGRVTTAGGGVYRGRLRWGGDEEAFWGHYLNGLKRTNPWAPFVPPELLPKERREVEILGIRIGRRQRRVDLGRPFMARFGDVRRIEARGRDVRVTLKSGTTIDLDRFAAGDFDDGVRVWDAERGTVDLGPRRIRAIELLPTPPLDAAPSRLYGTVRTPQGDFTGFLQWDRHECTGSDELVGRSDGSELRLRFDAIRSIARHAPGGSLVTLLDGREIVLSGNRKVGSGNRGIYVDDRRYGRVLISWEAFERADLRPAGSGPAYDDFPPGRPLTGSVVSRSGRRLAGRLVFDLDESETTETLDAPAGGVDYTIPFARIAAVVPAPADGDGPRVTLLGGEELELEARGDLGAGNAGLLIFAAGGGRPAYLPWADVARLELEPPPAVP
ncbi:MAG: hypothetical protein D6696_17125 [Acidobacteria bacterium]|nr:MAG: hypothetical protein D6696_17125 [Acidobacteriota bacterium]